MGWARTKHKRAVFEGFVLFMLPAKASQWAHFSELKLALACGYFRNTSIAESCG
jgi:hypothetical protein